jgi:hypothetical protein
LIACKFESYLTTLILKILRESRRITHICPIIMNFLSYFLISFIYKLDYQKAGKD